MHPMALFVLLAGCSVEALDRIPADNAASRTAGDTDAGVSADTGDSDPSRDTATTPGASDSEATSSVMLTDIAIPATLTAGEALAVEWRVTSAAGLGTSGEGPATWMTVGGASGWTRWCAFPTMAERIAGDAYDGVYRATCAFPATAPNGAYSVWISAADAYGNGPSGFEEAGSFEVVAGSEDAAPPVVTAVELTPEVVSAGATVVATFRVTDASGVEYAVPWVTGPNGFLTAPDGGLWVEYAAAVLESGDARDGVWTTDLRLRTDAMPGTYTVSFSAGDAVGNREYAWGSADAPSFVVDDGS